MSKYILLVNESMADYSGDEEVEIAKIIDPVMQKDIMYVDYHKHLYKQEGYHICIHVYENDLGEYPVAVTDDLHRDCLYDQPGVFLSIMLHEYGHYINGDLSHASNHGLYDNKGNLISEGITNDMIREERLRCLREGRVMDCELKADAVAISHVGKNTFMRSMDYLIKKRRERNDAGAQMAITEFELRKKAAKKH